MRSGETLELQFDEQRRILSVSNLNREARLLVERTLGTVWVEGEVSNLSRPASGHLYWSLKDPRAQVRCAMFRQANRSLGFALANGQQILVRARVSFYEARGEFQLLVDYVEEAGEGRLRREFEELKRRLGAEGLFDAERKREVPQVPRRIGVVTSPTGAAIRDVLTALRRRFPAAGVLVYPTSVQGSGAAEEIAHTLRLADRRRDCDVLILTRGGGSLEDLWAFNEEIVARAVAATAIPIIVGVGHETDFTIADFAADLRAPTPSQAAELAVPDCTEWLRRLDHAAARLERVSARRLADDARRVAVLAHRLERCHPGVILRQHAQRIDELEVRLARSLERVRTDTAARVARAASRLAAASPRHRVTAAAQRLHWAARRLEQSVGRRLERFAHRLGIAERALRSLSPLATLDRGYAIVTLRQGGPVLTDSSAATPGTGISVRLARGRLDATVDHSEPQES